MRMHQPGASAKLAFRFFAVAFVSVFLVASCGGTPTSSTSAPASHFPVSITEPSGAIVTIAHQPHRVVALSRTATEIRLAIRAGSQRIAVDDQSNLPANAPTTKLSGFTPNIEAIAAYTPDLVVAAEDTGSLVHGMQALNVPILLEPAARNLADSYLQIKQLGLATGHSAQADSLVASMRSQVGALVASVSKPARRLKVYHELDNTFYSVTSATFIGQAYKLLGLTNIADAATAATPDYPQLSPEFIVSSNPDLIVLADTKCCQQDLNAVAARPGWRAIAAVKSGHVVGVDDDIASRWGPRIVDFMRAVASHVKQIEMAA